MSDELREAVELPEWPAHRNAEWHRAQDVIRDAARSWLNLLDDNNEELRNLLGHSKLHDLTFSYEREYMGDEQRGLEADLASELRYRWQKKYGVDIEESLNISGSDVSRIAEVVGPVIEEWLMDYEPATAEEVQSWLAAVRDGSTG